MTRRAITLALEEILAASDVTHLYRDPARIETRTDVGDDAVELIGIQVEGRHARIGEASRYDLTKVVVRDRTAEPTESEIHPVDLVPVRSVAKRALGRIDARARLDVGAGVLMGSRGLRVSLLHSREEKREGRTVEAAEETAGCRPAIKAGGAVAKAGAWATHGMVGVWLWGEATGAERGGGQRGVGGPGYEMRPRAGGVHEDGRVEFALGCLYAVRLVAIQ